ncbi:glycoside hydrolase family 5 protein [Skermania sp. ID1734]|nr:glycoside hydrolase family 5 protein [Skermania sp. ID1734]
MTALLTRTASAHAGALHFASQSLLAQPVGVATVETQFPGANLAQDMAAIAQTGGNVVRIPVKWNLVQAWQKSYFDWSVVDTAVQAAVNNRLLIILNLNGPAPGWALKPGADPNANGNAPANPSDFGDFAQAVALRYAKYTSMYEIWNEPNLSHYLIPPTPSAYLPLLQAAYTSIRSVGIWNEPIITGGTSSSRAETRDIDFITGLYDLGGQQYFDGIGVHPYTFPYPLTGDPRYGDGGGAAVLQLARNLMVARGDGAKKLWITEYGQPTGNTDVSVTEEQQAQILVDAINTCNGVPWIGAVLIFNSRDLAVDSSVPDDNFGLYHNDYSPKQAVAAIRAKLASFG